MVNKKISVKITEYGDRKILLVDKGTKLADFFLKEKIKGRQPCGGNGKCGKCRIRFVSGAPKPSYSDLKFLTEKEISIGYRLLCRCKIQNDCEILLGDHLRDDEMDIQTMDTSNVGTNSNLPPHFGVAVDLGTTTIAAALIRKGRRGSGVISTASCVNRQKSYGADVISRIAAADDKNALENMKRMVREDIEELIKGLISKESEEWEGTLDIIAISGNTTMLHLLMGREVHGLGQYPYTAQNLELEEIRSEEVLAGIKGSRMVLLPCISAFVGADIVAGLYYLHRTRRISMPHIPVKGEPAKERALLLDLGTNGEMALTGAKRLVVTSTAAGPVFEGAGISCGVPSVPGAICHVNVGKDKRFPEDTCHRSEIETIGNAYPIGLCGTGVMELVSELIGAKVIDTTGLLADEYFDEGFPISPDGGFKFTQNDIRAVQMAKAAIYTGIKTITRYRRPGKIFVAGGFGSNIRLDKIKNIRMFPKNFSGRIETIGNSSLKGTSEYVKRALTGADHEKRARSIMGEICKRAEVLELSGNDNFSKEYIDAMNF